MFFIKTPLLLLSGGTSATLTEFAVDQLSGVLLDKLQEDGAISMETNMLASVILGMVGSRSFDADQLKKLIEDVQRLSKKAKQEDVKRLIAEIVEKWKVGAKKEVGETGDLAIDVANATEKQLDDIFAGLQNSPPYKYIPNTLEHKADRWAQYKARTGDNAMDYPAWSNTYNANMTKARTANQAADDVIASIGWGQREVTVQAGAYTRRMDIADKVAKKGVEVKSYETGKVYATEAIKGELNADKFLIDKDFWQIEWMFKGCEPSQPLRTLLEQASISIKLIP